jgi:hypothetical protein
MIQERFNKLSPFFRGIKIAEDYNIVEMSLKRNWKIPENEKIKSQDGEKGQFFYSETLSFDDILDWLENDVINYNLEIEEKERLLAAKVEELKRVFETSSLDELNNLKFSTEDDVLRLHNKNSKTEDNGITKELSETEHTNN